MRTRRSLPRPTTAPGRVVAVLVALSVVLGAAFVLAPGRLAELGSGGGLSERRGLVSALGTAFAGYWESGGRELPPDLQRVVDYWCRYHVAKAVLAAALLHVLAALAVRLWRAYLGSDDRRPGRELVLVSGGVLAGGAALLALAAVMANVQGALAPFSSLLPMLPRGGSGGRPAGVTAQIEQGLAHYPGTEGRGAAAVRTMVDDFGRYHAVLAVTAVVVAVVLAGLGVLAWRRSVAAGASEPRSRRLRRTRRAARAFALLAAVLASAAAVVAVANAGTAADPAPALLAFWQGGW